KGLNRPLTKEDIPMADKHTERFSASHVTKEMQIKTKRYHYTPMRMAKNQNTDNTKCYEGCGATGTLPHCQWECKMVQPPWKTVLRFLIKLSAPCAYPRKLKAYKTCVSCTPMFIAALSTIAKTWKEPKCPSTDEWIKKMWFIYTMEYYMAMRNNEIWPCVATWMDLEGVMLSEISQAEKDKYHMFARIGGL
ncbi:LORF2 protein, partial [Crocuta crocuta]